MAAATAHIQERAGRLKKGQQGVLINPTKIDNDVKHMFD